MDSFFITDPNGKRRKISKEILENFLEYKKFMKTSKKDNKDSLIDLIKDHSRKNICKLNELMKINISMFEYDKL